MVYKGLYLKRNKLASINEKKYVVKDPWDLKWISFEERIEIKKGIKPLASAIITYEYLDKSINCKEGLFPKTGKNLLNGFVKNLIDPLWFNFFKLLSSILESL